MVQLTPFEIGQIKAHAYHGLGAAAIAPLVIKPDGNCVSVQGVADVLAKLDQDSSWRGQQSEGRGRKRKTSRREDGVVVRAVFRWRGTAKVTVPWLKKRYPSLRAVSDTVVQRRLNEAGLQYLRRRRKTLVPKKHKDTRIKYAQRVLRLHQATLDRWAYSDGTTFYLDRYEDERENSQRAALGRFVWRKCDRSDALYADCVGPSAYNKAQGLPVRIWGVLAAGQLHLTILPVGTCMNRWWYAWVVKRYFRQWLGKCDQIIQDYERCLRCQEPMEEMKKLGVSVVPDYPACSQDLNAIENAWKILRDRLYETQPTQFEDRDAFISRLRAANRWVNSNCEEQLLKLSRNQKERATEVIRLEGSRTQW